MHGPGETGTRIRDVREPQPTNQVGCCDTEKRFDPEVYQRHIDAEIRERFSYHAPKADQVQRYQIVRDDFIALAIRITKLTPQGADRERAIEALHIAMMLTNRAIALE